MKLHPAIFWTLFSLSLVSGGIVFAQGENNEESGVIKMAPIPNKIGRLPPVQEGRLATRKQICDKYAKDTVEQLTWLENNNCGYGKDPFSNSQLLISYDVEYYNCMNKYPRRLGEKKFELSEIPIKIKERQKAIADCICKPYAETAVKQNSENHKYDCGYSDARWNLKYEYHYDWCARGGGKIIELGSYERFEADRDADLAKCKAPLAPVHLYPNAKTVPSSSTSLQWQDSFSSNIKAAEKFDLEVDINGKALIRETLPNLKVGESGATSHYWVGASKLPYAATVNWRVRGLNTYGSGPWSSASFDVVSGPPKILSFARDPDKASYSIGEEVTLKWRVQCPQMCSITLYGGINGSLFKLTNLPRNGSKQVVGLEQDTAYKLIVRSSNSTVYETTSVRTRPKSDNSSKVFYFKVKCPSTVNPCYVNAQSGSSSSQAKQIVQQLDTNCSVEEVSLSEYLDGCP